MMMKTPPTFESYFLKKINKLISLLIDDDDKQRLIMELACLLRTRHVPGYRPFDLSKTTEDTLRKSLNFFPTTNKRKVAFVRSMIIRLIKQAFKDSRFNAMLTNAPEYAKTFQNKNIFVDNEVIYDSFCQTGIPPLEVLKTGTNTYLMRFGSDKDARLMSEAVDGKQMGDKIVDMKFSPSTKQVVAVKPQFQPMDWVDMLLFVMIGILLFFLLVGPGSIYFCYITGYCAETDTFAYNLTLGFVRVCQAVLPSVFGVN